MSHRLAFALSGALALLFAVGVLVGRDRLFAEMDAAVAQPQTPSPAGVSGVGDWDRAPASEPVGVAPRVIEIPLTDLTRPETAWTDDDDDHDRDRFDGGERGDRHADDDDRDEEHDDD